MLHCTMIALYHGPWLFRRATWRAGLRKALDRANRANRANHKTKSREFQADYPRFPGYLGSTAEYNKFT